MQAAWSHSTQAAASPALHLPGWFLLIFFFVFWLFFMGKKIQNHKTTSNNECLDHLPSATPGCARAGGRDVADVPGSCTHFLPRTTLDLTWAALLGERDTSPTTPVARKAKSSVMRLDQLLLQLSRARPDNHRVSSDNGYQTQVPNPPAAQHRHPASGALAAPGCPDSICFANFLPLLPFSLLF